jgi:hypothetical protein
MTPDDYKGMAGEVVEELREFSQAEENPPTIDELPRYLDSWHRVLLRAMTVFRIRNGDSTE